MLCNLNLNLPFANGNGSGSVSDQYFILRPPGQMGGVMGITLPPLDSHPKTLRNGSTAPWKALPSAISAEGGGPGPAGTSPLLSRARRRQWHARSSLRYCISHSVTHLPVWALYTAAHYIHCGGVIAKGNLRCNPNLSIETPASQRSELAFNPALHSRHY